MESVVHVQKDFTVQVLVWLEMEVHVLQEMFVKEEKLQQLEQLLDKLFVQPDIIVLRELFMK